MLILLSFSVSLSQFSSLCRAELVDKYKVFDIQRKSHSRDRKKNINQMVQKHGKELESLCIETGEEEEEEEEARGEERREETGEKG